MSHLQTALTPACEYAVSPSRQPDVAIANCNGPAVSISTRCGNSCFSPPDGLFLAPPNSPIN